MPKLKDLQTSVRTIKKKASFALIWFLSAPYVGGLMLLGEVETRRGGTSREILGHMRNVLKGGGRS